MQSPLTHRHFPPVTGEQVLASLKLLNPVDAIGVLRRFAEQELCESYGIVPLGKALDEIEADYREDDEPRVSTIDERIGLCSWVAGVGA